MELNLPVLNLPDYTDRLKIKMVNERALIFDTIRRRWVALTPEEWIRQNMTLYIAETMDVSPNKMANETAITYNGMTKRCDTVVYDLKGNPLIVVEYKQPKVKITQQTFDQAAIYAMQLKVPYLIVSNGFTHFFCKIDIQNRRYIFANTWPKYSTLTSET